MPKHTREAPESGLAMSKRLRLEFEVDNNSLCGLADCDELSIDSAYISQGSDALESTAPFAVGSVATPASLTTTFSVKRPKIFCCEWNGCGKSFDRPARLAIHVRSHTNERPFVCTEPGCSKTFVRPEHLKAHHSSKHADDRKYICTHQTSVSGAGDTPILCGKSFHTNTKLKRHVAAHLDKEQTKCQDCGQVFRKQETLQRHIQSVHLNEEAFRCTHIEEIQAEECGQTFTTLSQLRAHTARDHVGVRYFCEECEVDADGGSSSQMGFTTYADLQLHLTMVHPPTCSICGHISTSNRGLRAHMEIVHQSLTDRQRFECTVEGCGRKFTKKGNLQVHIQTVHARIKAYTCGQFDLNMSKAVDGWSGLGCGVSFGTKAGLEQHVRTQHLGYPAISHKEDRKAMSNIKSSIGGITGHAYEERPLACLETSCASRFEREHDLAIHLELHHGWNIEDVNDSIAEAVAMNGDRFWIGGLDDIEHALAMNIYEPELA